VRGLNKDPELTTEFRAVPSVTPAEKISFEKINIRSNTINEDGRVTVIVCVVEVNNKIYEIAICCSTDPSVPFQSCTVETYGSFEKYQEFKKKRKINGMVHIRNQDEITRVFDNLIAFGEKNE
jgi:hypothetical protein